MSIGTPDNGLLSILYSVLRSDYHRKQGKERQQTLCFMGLVMCGMGAAMIYRGMGQGRGR